MGQSSGKAKPPQMDSQQARKAPSCPSLAPVTDLVEGGGEGLLASATGMARALVMGRPGLPRDSHVASTGSAHTAHSFRCQRGRALCAAGAVWAVLRAQLLVIERPRMWQSYCLLSFVLLGHRLWGSAVSELPGCVLSR